MNKQKTFNNMQILLTDCRDDIHLHEYKQKYRNSLLQKGKNTIINYCGTIQKKSNPLHTPKLKPRSSTILSKILRGSNLQIRNKLFNTLHSQKRHTQKLILGISKHILWLKYQIYSPCTILPHKKPNLIWSPTRTMYKGITNCAKHTVLQDKVQMLTQKPLL